MQYKLSLVFSHPLCTLTWWRGLALLLSSRWPHCGFEGGFTLYSRCGGVVQAEGFPSFRGGSKTPDTLQLLYPEYTIPSVNMFVPLEVVHDSFFLSSASGCMIIQRRNDFILWCLKMEIKGGHTYCHNKILCWWRASHALIVPLSPDYIDAKQSNILVLDSDLTEGK